MAEYIIQGETLDALGAALRSVASVNTKWSPEEMAAYILDYLVKPTTRQGAKTYTPGTSAQSIPAGTFCTGAQTIGAIPSSYVKPSATQAAKTWTPGTSDQSIAAGTYCSGKQTIKGDANLAEANIKAGKSIFGVPGGLVDVFASIASAISCTKAASGSFTITSAVEEYTLTHGLGVTPKIFIVYLDPEKQTIEYNSYGYSLGVYLNLKGYELRYATSAMKRKTGGVVELQNTTSASFTDFAEYYNGNIYSSGITTSGWNSGRPISCNDSTCYIEDPASQHSLYHYCVYNWIALG